jgi:hypothetical protein
MPNKPHKSHPYFGFIDKLLLVNLIITLLYILKHHDVNTFPFRGIIIVNWLILFWLLFVIPFGFVLFGFIKILVYRKVLLGVLLGVTWLSIGLIVLWRVFQHVSQIAV